VLASNHLTTWLRGDVTEWNDEAICLCLSRFGETAAIMDVFCRQQGRRRGLVHGGASRSRRALLQPGNSLHVVWRARTPDSLGSFSAIEPLEERMSRLLDSPSGLGALSAVAALLHAALPEGEPRPGLFDASQLLLGALSAPDLWPALFIRWEVGLLQEAGYGLDLSKCALTGREDDLAFVSPRTGRAVSASAAAQWADRLLPLPAFLTDRSRPPTPEDIASGFRLTGHFLENRLFFTLNEKPPESRNMMIDRLQREGRVSGRTR
jgi:DNA repair protein RecO (recombination protein O)